MRDALHMQVGHQRVAYVGRFPRSAFPNSDSGETDYQKGLDRGEATWKGAAEVDLSFKQPAPSARDRKNNSSTPSCRGLLTMNSGPVSLLPFPPFPSARLNLSVFLPADPDPVLQ